MQHARPAGEHRVEQGQLTGRVFDATGELMSPAFSRGGSGRVYRYYVSAALQQGGRAGHSTGTRVSAIALEKVLVQELGRLLPSVSDPLKLVRKISLLRERIDGATG